ncbi:hypothetical protein Tco_1103398 [Tanacetum coccineum]
MAVRTQPTLSPSMSARIIEAGALSLSSFHKKYRSSYETSSSSLSSSSSSSPTLPVWKRYRGTSEIILDTDREGDELGEEDTEEDESLNADDKRERERVREEDAAPEGQQHVVTVVNTAASKPLGRGYEAARCHALESTKEIAPSTYEVRQSSRDYTNILTYVPVAAPIKTPSSLEWSLGSLLVSPSSPVVPSPIASPVATLAATISRLDALTRTLFEGYDKDLRELYTRSRAVRDEIFSQRAALWHAIYDIQRENHDLRMQLAKERHERLELTDHVARMKRRHEFGGE